MKLQSLQKKKKKKRRKRRRRKRKRKRRRKRKKRNKGIPNTSHEGPRGIWTQGSIHALPRHQEEVGQLVLRSAAPTPGKNSRYSFYRRQRTPERVWTWTEEIREKHTERIIQIWRERKRKEWREEGRKEAVEMNVVHSGLYEINK